MANRYLTLLAILLFAPLGQVFGQCTVNPPSNSPGIYPNPAPEACQNQPYSLEVQFVFPLDTTVSVPPFGTFTIPFDSFQIDNILNVPPGLNFALNSPNGKYYPVSTTVSARGCGDVNGTPTMVNTYLDSVDIALTAWATAPIVGVQVGQDTIRIQIKVNPTPTAGFTPVTSTFDLNITDNSSGATSWFYDFGDGNTDTTQNPMHTYSGTGNYLVCQIATNGNCSDTTCQTVTIGCAAPTAAMGASFTGLNASFMDASLGTVTSWLWDFGDGNTSTAQNPSNTYASSGTYTVCLYATNACGTDTNCNVYMVCDPAVAGYSSSTANLDVSFTDGSSGQIASYAWDFGDGSTSTSMSPTHSYSAAGTYVACLTVTDSCGATDTHCDTLTVCATLTASFTNTTALLVADFTDGSSGTPVSWSWDFGDGNTSTQQNPQHTYTADGQYNVCLTVTDACGATDTSCEMVNVSTIGITDGFFESLKVFPNPNTGHFRIQLDLNESTDLEIRVVDLLGAEVYAHQTWAPAGSYRQEVNLGSLPQGVYILQLSDGHTAGNFKISITH